VAPEAREDRRTAVPAEPVVTAASRAFPVLLLQTEALADLVDLGTAVRLSWHPSVPVVRASAKCRHPDRAERQARPPGSRRGRPFCTHGRVAVAVARLGQVGVEVAEEQPASAAPSHQVGALVP
jgi:hypothetical protein